MEVARRVVGYQGTEAPLLTRADLVAAYLQPVVSGLEVEKFWALCLNRKNRLLKRVEVTSGTATAALAHPREVFRAAIRESSSALVCVHNHPSGDPAPERPRDVRNHPPSARSAKTVEITLLDHIILGRPGADPLGRRPLQLPRAGGLGSGHDADCDISSANRQRHVAAAPHHINFRVMTPFCSLPYQTLAGTGH